MRGFNLHSPTRLHAKLRRHIFTSLTSHMRATLPAHLIPLIWWRVLRSPALCDVLMCTHLNYGNGTLNKSLASNGEAASYLRSSTCFLLNSVRFATWHNTSGPMTQRAMNESGIRRKLTVLTITGRCGNWRFSENLEWPGDSENKGV
jgi:hypothetical protein